jgi:hypothetical protein
MSITPKHVKNLPGSIWGMTTFYNPSGYDNKKKNYDIFRDTSKKQGLKLLCVELAFGDKKFELTKNDADILVQLRTNTVLWHKERLLNTGLASLPKDCDKIVWLDADIMFTNNDWLKKTEKLLEKYKVVQPYSFAVRLKKGQIKIPSHDLPFGNGEGEKIHGIGYGIHNYGKKSIKRYLEHGHTGFVWAARRDVLDECGFYDRFILGSGDALIAQSFYGNMDWHMKKRCSKALSDDISEYMEKVHNVVGGSVYYTNGNVCHIWHGKHKNRQHNHRIEMLKKFKFDPKKDIVVGDNGCWVWATDKPNLHKWVKQYFWTRNEEGAFIQETMMLFWRLKRKVISKFISDIAP